MPQDVEFAMPFPYRINPELDEARARNLAWARRFGLLGSEEAQRRYVFSQVAEFGAYAYPDATGDDLALIFDVMGWFFLFDDQFDVSSPEQFAEATAACQEHIAVVTTEGDITTYRPTVQAFADCWRRMCEGTSREWRARAAHAWVEYLSGQLTEVADRYADAQLGYDNHLRLRHKTIGVGPSFCLAERTGGLDVPSLAWHSSHLEQMRMAAIDHVIAVNEIYSLEKEEAQDAPNLIRFLVREQHFTRQDAIHHLRDQADQRLRRYRRLEERIPQLCEGLGLTELESSAVARYAGAISAWIRGNYDWHRSAGRYTSVAASPDEHIGTLNTEDLSSPRALSPAEI